MKHIQSEILNQYHKLAKAMVERDLVVLNQLLADDYTLVHMTGVRQTKVVWLNEVQSEAMRYYDVEMVDVDWHVVTDDHVVVTIDANVDARIYGSRHVWPLRSKLTVNKIENKWRFSYWEASTF